jgi:hypothetical protein
MPDLTPKHPPLSKILQDILENEDPNRNITLKSILIRTEGRSYYLMMIILCLPFIAPISVPGLSTLCGIAIAWISWKISFGLKPVIPGFILDKEISPPRWKKILSVGVKVFSFIEKWIHPRQMETNLKWSIFRVLNCWAIIIQGILLALPVPVPLTNFLPAYTIIIISISIMEDDTLFLFLGHILGFFTIIYFIAIGDVIFVFIRKHLDFLDRLLFLLP